MHKNGGIRSTKVSRSMYLTTRQVTYNPMRDILASASELPPSGRLLPELRRLLADPRTDQAAVVDLLRVDAALTAKVLRLANSAAMGLGEYCDGIDAAVERLGFGEVYRGVVTIASGEMLGGSLPLYRMEAGELWCDGLAAAVAAASIGPRLSLNKGGDVFYTAALLHGVGRVALNAYALKRGFVQFGMAKDPSLAAQAEKSLFGAHFAEVGAAMLERWHFSPEMVQLVRDQLRVPGASSIIDGAAVLRLAIDAIPFVRNPERPAEELTEMPSAIFVKLAPDRLVQGLSFARQMYAVFGSVL